MWTRPSDIYDEAIRRLDADGETGAENWAAQALLGKMLLLSGSNRRHEAMAVCDDLVRRFETRRDTISVTAVVIALNHRGLALIGEGEASKAIDLADQALAHLERIATPYNDASRRKRFCQRVGADGRRLERRGRRRV